VRLRDRFNASKDKGHGRAVAILRHYPKRVSDRDGGRVNHELIHIEVPRTSSNSCSPGGVLGREGTTDSAARRPIVESESESESERKGRRKFPSNVFRESYTPS
jgi:hypothetical protein